MALDLSMTITADASQAKAELRSVEQGIGRVEQAARKGEPSVAEVAKQLGVMGGQAKNVNTLASSVDTLTQKTIALSGAQTDVIRKQLQAGTDLSKIVVPGLNAAVTSSGKLAATAQALGGRLGETAKHTAAVSSATQIMTGHFGLSSNAALTYMARLAGVNQQQAVVVRGLAATAQAAGMGATATMGIVAAVLAAVAAYGLLLKFLWDSAKAYAEKSGILVKHQFAIEGVKTAWQNMYVTVGAALIGNAKDFTFWFDVVASKINQLGGIIAAFVVKIKSDFAMVGWLLGKAGGMLPGTMGSSAATLGALLIGTGAKSSTPFTPNEDTWSEIRGGYQSPFAFGPGGPMGPTRSAAEDLALDAGIAKAASKAALAAAKRQALIDRLVNSLHYQFMTSMPGQNVGYPVLPGTATATPPGAYDFGGPGGMSRMPGVNVGYPTIPKPYQQTFFGRAFSPQFGAQMGQNVIGAIGGGGSITGAIGGTIGSSLMQSVVGGFSKTFTSSFLGQTLGAALPGIGALAGPLLTTLMGKFFGETQGHKDLVAGNKQIADMKKNLLEAYGGMQNLDQMSKIFGVDIKAAWGSQNLAGAEQFKKLMEELAKKQAEFNDDLGTAAQGILEWGGKLPEALQPYIDKLKEAGVLTQDNQDLLAQLAGAGEIDWKRMEEVAGKYGISIDSLGPRFQEQRLHEGWQEIIDDMDLLIRGGADANGVLHGMADEISLLVQQSILFGTDIPENMRPWIVKLIETGDLLDANGDKITDISQLHFGESLATSLEKFIQKLTELLEKMGLIGPSAEDAANQWNHAVDRARPFPNPWNGDDNGDDGTREHAAWGGRVGPFGVIPFARGGLVRPVGTDSVPALLTPGEIVLTAAQQRRVAGAIQQGTVSGSRPSRTALPVTIQLGSRTLWQGLLEVAHEEGLV